MNMDIGECNMNDYFKALRDFCHDKQKEEFVWSRRLLDIDKTKLIIFEADFNKIDFSILDDKPDQILKMPTEKLFIEIPKWVVVKENMNIGNFLVEGIKGESPDNRRIDLAKGKIFRMEQKLGNILKEIFPNEFIKRHDRKAVKPLELDFYIRDLNLAFEYDGEQHFDKKICEEVFSSNFKELQKRDRKKEVMCRIKNIKLVRVKYDEQLNITNIKRKVKELIPDFKFKNHLLSLGP